MNNWIEIIKSLVRPYISIAFVTAILVLGIILAYKFADADMARQLLTFILATGATVTGFWFAERKK